jgi:ABC-type multidrug transport system fused ATPase/permease subunit
MKPIRVLLPLLDRRDRARIAGLAVLILGGSVLETFGVGAVFPFVALIQDPETASTSKLLNPVYRALGQPDYPQFVLFLAVGLAVFFLVKNGYLALVTFIQQGFIKKKRVDIAHELFDSYLRKPYTFHLERNSADLVRNLTIEISRVVNNVIMATIQIVTDGAVAVGLMALLVVADPISALAAMLLVGVTGLAFFSLVRRELSDYGSARLDQQGQLIRQINHAVGGIKEVKILGAEDYFLGLFDRNNQAFASAYRYYETLKGLPRLFFETIAVFALAGLIYLVHLDQTGMHDILPTLSLFAVAAFRLMPTVNSIQSSVNSVRFFADSVSVVAQDIDVEPSSAAASSGSYVDYSAQVTTVPKLSDRIAVKGLGYQYPGSAVRSISNVDLVIPFGTAVGLAGRSGAGKTTLVNVLLGLLEPTSGNILVDGVDIRTDISAWQRQIGYIPQSIYLIDDTLRRNIALGLPDSAIDESRVWTACRTAKLDDFIEGLDHGLDTVVGERGVRLSGGQLQRVGIARAIFRDPSILVMDEATASLDSKTELEIVKTLESAKGSRTLVMIAHRLSTLELCDVVCVLKGGVLVETGTLAELRSRGAEFMAVMSGYPHEGHPQS